MSTLIAIATYNEIENLPQLVPRVLRVAPDVDLLVVDDNSPDGTGRWVDQQRLQEPRLRCLHRPGKQGLGTATVAIVVSDRPCFAIEPMVALINCSRRCSLGAVRRLPLVFFTFWFTGLPARASPAK